jgi:hypothetical protein
MKKEMCSTRLFLARKISGRHWVMLEIGLLSEQGPDLSAAAGC